MQFLEWLQSWPFSIWVQESEWGFPVLLSFHSIGLAVVVGILVMLDDRILGFANKFPISTFSNLMKWAWAGFIVNAISGSLLFAADGVRLTANWAFLLKMAAVLFGVVTAWMISRELNFTAYQDASESEAAAIGEPTISMKVKSLATAQLIFWTVAIVAGRLIAYVNGAFALGGVDF